MQYPQGNAYSHYQRTPESNAYNQNFQYRRSQDNQMQGQSFVNHSKSYPQGQSYDPRVRQMGKNTYHNSEE